MELDEFTVKRIEKLKDELFAMIIVEEDNQYKSGFASGAYFGVSRLCHILNINLDQ
jgi:hypothetical protein